MGIKQEEIAMESRVECAKCSMVACRSNSPDVGPEDCPTRTRRDVVDAVLPEYEKPDIKEFARNAAIQAYEGYIDLPEGWTPRYPRVEEVAQFATKMNYKKLGIATCSGLLNEARLLTEILENRGFEVVSISCQAGGFPKERVGVTDTDKVTGSISDTSVCSPIVQAEILNREDTDFNVLLGLCVGHDYLFFKYSKVPCTVLIAKDRVFGHNPAAALYQSHAYYRKLLRKELQ